MFLEVNIRVSAFALFFLKCCASYLMTQPREKSFAPHTHRSVRGSKQWTCSETTSHIKSIDIAYPSTHKNKHGAASGLLGPALAS